MTPTDATPPSGKPEPGSDGVNGTTGANGSGVAVQNDRRKRNIPVATDRRAKNAAEARRKSERRGNIDPTTCERDYTEDEIEFMKAMDRYKKENRRPFPTWSEVLEVLHSMGYRRVAEKMALPGGKRTPGTTPNPAPPPSGPASESTPPDPTQKT